MSTHELVRSGRFNIAIVKTIDESLFKDFDEFILKLHRVVTNKESVTPFKLEFNKFGDLVHVVVTDKTLFNDEFGPYMKMLHKCNKRVRIGPCGEVLENIIAGLHCIVDSLECNIIKTYGGNVFPMFPECVGYVYKLFTYFGGSDPHEYLEIDSDDVVRYLREKL